jgi:hypothetical protein
MKIISDIIIISSIGVAIFWGGAAISTIAIPWD